MIDDGRRDLVAAYVLIERRILARVADLTAQIAAAERAGRPVGPSWLIESRRLQTLLAQVEAELASFGRHAAGTIADAQARAVTQAQQPAGVDLTFARLPRAPIADLVGTLGDGQPLAALLDTLGPQGSRAVKEALIAGLAVGQGPRAIARQIRRAMGMSLSRALTIARTETLRAYRTSAIRTYQANSDVVRGWRWVATLSSRTCAVCIAMHGTEHDLDEPFATHPNCRCVPSPIVRQERATPAETGAAWFARQPAATRIAILGPAKLAAYQAGRIDLPDLVGTRRSLRWGPARYEKSLAHAIH